MPRFSDHRLSDRWAWIIPNTDRLSTLALVLIVLAVGVALATVWMTLPLRDSAVVIGLMVLFVGAFFSGNPRLYCIWGLMLTLPLSLSKRFGPMNLGKPGGEDSFRVEVSDLFLFSLAAILVWELLTGQKRGLRVPRVSFTWLLLILVGCAWIVVGPWRLPAAHEVVRMLKVLLLFIVLTNEFSRPERVWHGLVALLVSGIVQASVGLAQFQVRGLLGLEILGETSEAVIDILSATSVEGTGVFRPSALMQHANLFGIFLSMVIPMSLGLLMVTRRMAARLFFLGVLLICIPGMLVTLSRSSWLSAAIGVSLLLVFAMRHPVLKWRSISVTMLTLVVGAAVLAPFTGQIAQRLFRSKADATVAREIYKEDAKRMIASAPWVGRGLNSYSFEMPGFASLSLRGYGPAMVSVHHIFYLWWSETGLIGMLLFCLVWASIIWTGLANLTVRDEVLFVANAACVAGMIALIPDAFLSFTLRVNTMLRVFWVMAAVIMAVRYLRLQERVAALQSEPAGPLERTTRHPVQAT